MKRGLALLLVLVAGCPGPNDPKALRNLGEECVGCHRPGQKAAQWPFTAGGTVYRTPTDDPAPGLENVRITLTDARGRTVRLVSNRAGNFWTNEPLAFPVAVELQREGAERRATVSAGPCTSGLCNGCHARPPRSGAPGRLFAPR